MPGHENQMTVVGNLNPTRCVRACREVVGIVTKRNVRASQCFQEGVIESAPGSLTKPGQPWRRMVEEPGINCRTGGRRDNKRTWVNESSSEMNGELSSAGYESDFIRRRATKKFDR
jgi:hypothetical protein